MNNNSKFFIILILILFSQSAICKSISSLKLEKINGKAAIVFANRTRLSGLTARYEGMKEAPKLSAMSAGNLTFEWLNGDFASIETKIDGNVIVISGAYNHSLPNNPNGYLGCFFDSINDYKIGMCNWRYKPWNSWTKPILIESMDSMPDWDVQFFYWKYNDGTYGAAMPLSDKGFRTTLGRDASEFGAKSVSYKSNTTHQEMLQMAIGFGRDPYELFKTLYKKGLTAMGKSNNSIENKKFPDALNYLGWCTWNASDKGHNLNDSTICSGVKSFVDKKIPLGMIIIDDGWQDNTNSRLNSLHPTKTKFPNGFKELNARLKANYGLAHVGLWNAFNGHWNGINPDSELGRKYANALFTWSEKANEKTYSFIRPDKYDALAGFYDDWCKYQKSEGFSFLKVDNQLVTERMALNNFPIDSLSAQMHKALYAAVDKYMDGGLINCMCMTNEAFYNFGTSAVARAVEDYFPEHEGGVGYKMEQGGAAAHLIMALYNNLYFSNMVYTDFDMFESNNSHGTFHAIARAANNGPIYLTDKPGKQDVEVLRPLTYSDGTLIRPQSALTLTEDCLFQGQAAKPIKAFSNNKFASIMCAWNMSDADKVTGAFKPSDIYGIQGDAFIAYEYFSKKAIELNKNQSVSLNLSRMGYAMYHIVKKHKLCTPIGLTNKYNVSGTLVDLKYEKNRAYFTVDDSGFFCAYANTKPNTVKLDGVSVSFEYSSNLIKVNIPAQIKRTSHVIAINW